MKVYLLIFFFYFSSNCLAQSSNDTDEVKQTIENFFVAFHAKDTLKLKTICSDKMILQSVSEDQLGSKLTYESVSKFYKSIATIPTTLTFLERILSYSIQVDGAMASVWIPYEFYINGKLSHKGVNSFTLFKENNYWKIIYCIDTRRK